MPLANWQWRRSIGWEVGKGKKEECVREVGKAEVIGGEDEAGHPNGSMGN